MKEKNLSVTRRGGSGASEKRGGTGEDERQPVMARLGPLGESIPTW